MVQWSEGLAIFVPCVVELICAMFLVLLGCGSTVNWPQEETAPTVLTISLSFGFLNAFLGNISTCFSGGFFNPAITASLVSTRTMPVKTAFCFILAQLLGAVIGAGLLYFIVPSESHEYLGMTLVKPVSCLTGCGVEVLMTTVVTLTVLHTSDGGQRTIDYSASVVIGLAVSVCHLFGFPITGCGINPARSFGPAVIMNKWRTHWVYWAGPIIGAQLAAAIHHLLNNFPVTTVNELVVSGRQLTNKAVSAPLEPSKSENHPPTPTQVTGQADSPCELTTSL
ncbi:aquaporin AQPAe.a-like [Montipora foliosa]|uniref:aquaporin AQPAe.a-like n=1 Tax=Montipora foliosa TaxID=591990 RepID=UPI0035F1988B